MRTRQVAVIVAMIALGGCATHEEWGTWNSHSAHFASGQHMVFSLRNKEGGTPSVARRDVALASTEAWWGKAITVGQEQIIER
jgi:hypothetical protein